MVRYIIFLIPFIFSCTNDSSDNPLNSSEDSMVRQVFIETLVDVGDTSSVYIKYEFHVNTYNKLLEILKEAHRIPDGIVDSFFREVSIDLLLDDQTYIYRKFNIEFSKFESAIIQFNKNYYLLDYNETNTLRLLIKNEILDEIKKRKIEESEWLKYWDQQQIVYNVTQNETVSSKVKLNNSLEPNLEKHLQSTDSALKNVAINFLQNNKYLIKINLDDKNILSSRYLEYLKILKSENDKRYNMITDDYKKYFENLSPRGDSAPRKH